MRVKYEIRDDLDGRDLTAEIDAAALAQCATLESAQCAIARDIQAAFEEHVEWWSGALAADQARALWEAAKAAQEADNAGK